MIFRIEPELDFESIASFESDWESIARSALPWPTFSRHEGRI